jgi:hypothetical protein
MKTSKLFSTLAIVAFTANAQLNDNGTNVGIGTLDFFHG